MERLLRETDRHYSVERERERETHVYTHRTEVRHAGRYSANTSYRVRTHQHLDDDECRCTRTCVTRDSR